MPKKLTFSLFLLAMFLVACGRGASLPTSAPTAAQAPSASPPAILERLHWLGHASFRLDGPPVIYFDPTVAKDDSPKAGVILVSHLHDDHYAPRALKSLSTADTIIVTSAAVAQALEKVSGLEAEVRILAPGENTTIGDVLIEALPAYNLEKNFHPKDAGNLGFVVTSQGERLYFAGDTSRIPEMAGLKPDVALLPIDGTYTMDIAEATLAAADLQARVIVPMHNNRADPQKFQGECNCQAIVMPIEK